MKTKRSFGILFLLTVVMGLALSGCQTLPPVTLSHAVDRANDFMRSTGHPPSHYDVPNAYYRLEDGGWLVIFRSRQGFVTRHVYVLVPDNGPAHFTQDMPEPAIDDGYYNHP
jgi:hypothetical protein